MLELRMLERFTQYAIGSAPARYNVAPAQVATVLVGDEPQPLRWGLLAPWRGHGGVRPPPIRIATLDALATTPVLRRAAPCLVPGDGVFAKTKNGSKIRAWWLTPGRATFAAVTATAKDDGVPAFALLVVPAPPAVGAYTDVVPMVVDAGWLDGGEASDATWRAVEVARYFEELEHDDPNCIAPLGGIAQGSLF